MAYSQYEGVLWTWKSRKARGDGAGLTVQTVRLSIATSWPSEKAVKSFPLSQYSTTVTGCARYRGFHRLPRSDNVGVVVLMALTGGCDPQPFTLVYWQPWWKNNPLLTSKRLIANANAVMFCGINWEHKVEIRALICILIDELRLSLIKLTRSHNVNVPGSTKSYTI